MKRQSFIKNRRESLVYQKKEQKGEWIPLSDSPATMNPRGMLTIKDKRKDTKEGDA